MAISLRLQTQLENFRKLVEAEIKKSSEKSISLDKDTSNNKCIKIQYCGMGDSTRNPHNWIKNKIKLKKDK